MQGDDEIIIESSWQDVSPDNYDAFDHELDAAKFGEKLVQENRLKGTYREYQIYASRYLLLKFIEGKKAAEKQFRVDLTYVSSEPEHKKTMVLNWLYGATATGLLTCLFIILAIQEMLGLEYCLLGGTVTLTTAAICSLVFVYLMRDEYIFRSQFGNVVLFLVENRRPSQKDFDQFLIALQNTIDRSQSKVPVADRLVNELKMCRRLKDEGIIDDETYTAARTAIFKHKQYKA